MKSLHSSILDWIPWTARRSNQSILKDINSEYSLEGLMVTLKLQYFGHLIRELTHLKRPWCWERLRAGGEAGGRGWDGCMASQTQWTWVWAHLGDNEGQGSLVCCIVHGIEKSRTWLSNWTTTMTKEKKNPIVSLGEIKHLGESCKW